MHTHHCLLGPGLELGTVYGVLLNDLATLERLRPQFDHAPYLAAPRSAVLYIKSRNTFAADGAVVEIPAEPGVVRVEATLGLVIGRTASRVPLSEAMAHVAGLVIASDLCLPHESYYRPALVQRNRDGFCPLTSMAQAEPGFDLDSAVLYVDINGQRRHARSFATLVRTGAQLLAEVTEFMTLAVGDVLLLGPGEGAPLAGAGDRVEITVPGLGSLRHSLVKEAQP